jgi:hypothetical protein
METLKHFEEFFWSVVNNWAGYCTGGLIVAIVWFWNAWKDRPMPRKFALFLAALFFVLACFKAWDDERANNQNQITYIEPDPAAGLKIMPPNQLPLFKAGRQSLINIGVSNIGAYRADNEYNPLSLEIHDVDPTFDPTGGPKTNHSPTSSAVENEVFAAFRKRQSTWRLPRTLMLPGRGGFSQASTAEPLSEVEVEQLKSEKKIMYLVGFTKWQDAAGTHERRFCYFIQPPADVMPFVLQGCYTLNDFKAIAED